MERPRLLRGLDAVNEGRYGAIVASRHRVPKEHRDGASTIALVKSKSRPLRTLLAQTLLAQLASLFVVQYWAEFQIQDGVPV